MHRHTARLTQEQLAEKSGLSIRTVADLERGRVRRPQRETVRRLVAAFGLDDEAREELEVAARDAYWSGVGPSGDASRRVAAHKAGCQLPLDVADFAGRDDEVAGLVEHVVEH